jgi:hypothetical protein
MHHDQTAGHQPHVLHSPPPGETATATLICLGGIVVADLLYIAAEGNHLVALRGVDAGTTSEAQLGLAELFLALVALGYIAALIATATSFSLWFYRAVRFGRQLLPPDSPARGPAAGWAVGSFFVPFANLVIPLKAAVASWQASHAAEQYALGRPSGVSPSTSLVTGWWGMWVLSNFVYGMATRMWVRPPAGQPVDRVQVTLIDMGGDVLSIIAAVLCWMMVRRLTAVQGRVYSLASGEEVPPLMAAA